MLRFVANYLTSNVSGQDQGGIVMGRYTSTNYKMALREAITPTQVAQIGRRLASIALTGEDRDSIQATALLLSHLAGRPSQSVTVTTPSKSVADLSGELRANLIGVSSMVSNALEKNPQVITVDQSPKPANPPKPLACPPPNTPTLIPTKTIKATPS